MSLDGYIAGPNGEFDWIITNPEIDFKALFKRFDTVLLGRRTFELTLTQGDDGGMPGMRLIVFSRTLRPSDYPKVTIVSENAGGVVAALRDQPGKDIWLMGGGVLFRSLLDAGQVDSVEVGVIPVLLGGGIPLLPPPGSKAGLQLAGSRIYSKTGIVSLEYTVQRRKGGRTARTSKTART
jgi:dihydrofolate reductase